MGHHLRVLTILGIAALGLCGCGDDEPSSAATTGGGDGGSAAGACVPYVLPDPDNNTCDPACSITSTSSGAMNAFCTLPCTDTPDCPAGLVCTVDEPSKKCVIPCEAGCPEGLECVGPTATYCRVM